MQKPQPKKTNLSPAAAKVLEQYRNAGKPSANGGPAGPMDGDDATAPRQPAPPPSSQMRRSGTRGK